MNKYSVLVDAIMAAKDLVLKLQEVHNDPEYLSVWTLHQVRNGNYSGPTYTQELNTLKTKLKDIVVTAEMLGETK